MGHAGFAEAKSQGAKGEHLLLYSFTLSLTTHIHKYTTTQIHKYTNTQIYKYTNTNIQKHIYEKGKGQSARNYYYTKVHKLLTFKTISSALYATFLTAV